MYDIQKVKTESLRAKVYAKLKEQLTRGIWKEGEKLPSEHELCSLFGVSRVTVRAAIQQLEILGLVETKQGGGTFVKTSSPADQVDAFHPLMRIRKNQDLIAVLEYRKIVEKGAVGLAQDKIGPGDIESLEELYQGMVDSKDDLKAFIEADLAFHFRIAEICRNSIIIKVYGLINEILSVAMVDIVHILGRRGGLKYHRAIIDALKLGDKARSEALMEEHIEVTIQEILKKGEKNENTVTD
jgi:GntR family transcriptional repressor for pyruvate dehydrogenase complex